MTKKSDRLMLIRVSITNFKSFNEETEFNMLASSDQRSHKEHVYSHNGVDLLKTAAIYGANGAGKSNLVKAVAILQKVVLQGGGTALDDFDRFKLLSKNQDAPSTIEVEFIKEGRPYIYGLSVHKRIICEEWLYESGLGMQDDVLLLHRRQEKGKLKIELNPKYLILEEDKFRLDFYQNEFLKENSLLLKNLADLKKGFAELKQVYEWFLDDLVLVFPLTKPQAIVAQLHSSPSYKAFANELIRSFQTGISELFITSSTLNEFLGDDDKTLMNNVSQSLKEGKEFVSLNRRNNWGSQESAVAVLENDIPVVKQLTLRHTNEQNDLIDFTLYEESDGTNRLLDFTSAFYLSIHADITVIIDEIDQSIHPALLKKLVQKFANDPDTKGQLIFTTHESNLLDQSIFRRDEIWFAEKHEGATRLYPLSDFDIRLDLDIRKGYLNGRFGAIPFLGNLADLNWDQYAEA